MKGSIRGLTTAAGIWMVATIGMAVGVGMYVISVIATALILFILVELERLEQHVSKGSESRIIRLRLGVVLRDIDCYRKILLRNKITLQNFYVDYDYEARETRLNLVVLLRESTDYIKLFGELEKLQPTKAISLANQLSI